MSSAFYLKTTLIGLALWLISSLVQKVQSISNSSAWILTIILYAALTILFKRWVDGTKNKSAISFTTTINGVTAVKMLTTLLIITAYLATEQPNQTEYVFSVFIVFTIYTTLLVYEIQREIRKGQKNS